MLCSSQPNVGVFPVWTMICFFQYTCWMHYSLWVGGNEASMGRDSHPLLLELMKFFITPLQLGETFHCYTPLAAAGFEYETQQQYKYKAIEKQMTCCRRRQILLFPRLSNTNFCHTPWRLIQTHKVLLSLNGKKLISPGQHLCGHYCIKTIYNCQ